jgi:hypothetical protein
LVAEKTIPGRQSRKRERRSAGVRIEGKESFPALVYTVGYMFTMIEVKRKKNRRQSGITIRTSP